jgi:glycosyltransferase involved in cell wall biosynthesis
LKVRAEREKSKEQELMSQMDVIFSCSDTEAELIRTMCPRSEVHYVPPYSVEVDLSWEFDAGTRADLLFVGGFSHPPNVDGVLWFVREVWPEIKNKLPGVVFRIVGSAPPPEVLALESEDVRVLGFVSEERLRELYRTSRLVVIPLRYGAGVKGKTVEAMAHGVPLVSTPCGVEGMPGVEEVLDPAQFRGSLAEGIVALYDDALRLRAISQRERAYTERLFTPDKIQESFAQATSERR